jgi:phosphomannomutase
MAAAAGARYAETLTGFKWIMRALAGAPDHRLLLAYEEALGYAVSAVVRDKDGISAALVLAQLAALEKRAGRTLADRLDDIAARFGRHATEPVTRELAGPDGTARRERIMAALRADPPATLLGRPVIAVEDLRDGARGLPPSDVLILRAEGARVVVRPSGTEPKLKAYLEVVVDAADEGAAAAALARLRAEIGRVLTA